MCQALWYIFSIVFIICTIIPESKYCLFVFWIIWDSEKLRSVSKIPMTVERTPLTLLLQICILLHRYLASYDCLSYYSYSWLSNSFVYQKAVCHIFTNWALGPYDLIMNPEFSFISWINLSDLFSPYMGQFFTYKVRITFIHLRVVLQIKWINA